MNQNKKELLKIMNGMLKELNKKKPNVPLLKKTENLKKLMQNWLNMDIKY